MTGDDKLLVNYVSPLSDGCLNHYYYHLDDFYLNSGDTVFIINFTPRQGKNFNGLKGRLYVNSNNYALKTVVTEPFETGLLNFKFKQDYELVNNKWFPSNLDEEIGFPEMSKTMKFKGYPVYIISSRIDNVHYNFAGTQKNINLEKVYLDDLSPTSSDSILEANRSLQLSSREINTYLFMDSLSRKHHLDRWFYLYKNILTDRLPLGCIDLSLSRLYDYNAYEGSQYGLGIMTNNKLSGIVSVGGFWRYGNRDERHKYGGQLMIELNKYHDVSLIVSAQKNLKEVGFTMEKTVSPFSYNNYLRKYIESRFDKCEEQKVELQFRTLRNFKVSTGLSLKSLQPLYHYSFNGLPLTNYLSDEMFVTIKYACGEEFQKVNDYRSTNFEGNPVITIACLRGTNFFNRRSYVYNRWESTFDIAIFKGTIGQSNIHLKAGLIDHTVPYGLLFTGDGSKSRNMPLIINNSFQTMVPYEFLSDRYINLFYTHNFGTLLFKTRNFKPEFVIVHNSGWGSLKNASYHDIDFKVSSKIYLESGVIINSIIKANFSTLFYINLGMGTFYRYGYYGYAKNLDNFALKLTLSVSLK